MKQPKVVEEALAAGVTGIIIVTGSTNRRSVAVLASRSGHGFGESAFRYEVARLFT